jgi:hypothetical protein
MLDRESGRVLGLRRLPDGAVSTGSFVAFLSTIRE